MIQNPVFSDSHVSIKIFCFWSSIIIDFHTTLSICWLIDWLIIHEKNVRSHDPCTRKIWLFFQIKFSKVIEERTVCEFVFGFKRCFRCSLVTRTYMRSLLFSPNCRPSWMGKRRTSGCWCWPDPGGLCHDEMPAVVACLLRFEEHYGKKTKAKVWVLQTCHQFL